MEFIGAKPFSKLCSAAAAVSLLLSGCATPGVSGSGPGGLVTHRVAKPRLTSGEYLRSWGLAMIDANAAYRVGATGRGVTVALIDCGLLEPQKELNRNLSPRSTDLLAGRQLVSTDRHGSLVAGPLVSPLNGRGLLGVAYNATMLAIRADIDGGVQGECAFWPSDLGRAIDYAVAQNARVIVLPVQGRKPLGPAFEGALKRASDAGVVTIIAAGNRAGSEPTWPARYAADPRFGGAVVAVGATRPDGSLATWSNKAGAAQARYLVAPGERVVTDCGAKTCQLVSGTSFAAPYVAGALALVMEAYPGLSGIEAAEKLLSSARDVGSPGDDPTFGRGMLDLGGVFGRSPTGPVVPVRRAG